MAWSPAQKKAARDALRNIRGPGAAAKKANFVTDFATHSVNAGERRCIEAWSRHCAEPHAAGKFTLPLEAATAFAALASRGPIPSAPDTSFLRRLRVFRAGTFHAVAEKLPSFTTEKSGQQQLRRLAVHAPFLGYLMYRDAQVLFPHLPDSVTVGDGAESTLTECTLGADFSTAAEQLQAFCKNKCKGPRRSAGHKQPLRAPRPPLAAPRFPHEATRDYFRLMPSPRRRPLPALPVPKKVCDRLPPVRGERAVCDSADQAFVLGDDLGRLLLIQCDDLSESWKTFYVSCLLAFVIDVFSLFSLVYPYVTHNVRQRGCRADPCAHFFFFTAMHYQLELMKPGTTTKSTAAPPAAKAEPGTASEMPAAPSADISTSDACDAGETTLASCCSPGEPDPTPQPEGQRGQELAVIHRLLTEAAFILILKHIGNKTHPSVLYQFKDHLTQYLLAEYMQLSFSFDTAPPWGKALYTGGAMKGPWPPYNFCILCSTNPSVALWRAPPPHSCGHLALHCRPSSDGDMILTLEGNNFGLRPLMDELQVSASDAGSGYVRRTHPLRLQDETDLNLLHAISVRPRCCCARSLAGAFDVLDPCRPFHAHVHRSGAGFAVSPDESTYLETTASLEEEPVAATAPVAPPIAVPLRGGGTKARAQATSSTLLRQTLTAWRSAAAAAAILGSDSGGSARWSESEAGAEGGFWRWTGDVRVEDWVSPSKGADQRPLGATPVPDQSNKATPAKLQVPREQTKLLPTSRSRLLPSPNTVEDLGIRGMPLGVGQAGFKVPTVTAVAFDVSQPQVDPSELGAFMGEDFSLAQTLRLAFVHTMAGLQDVRPSQEVVVTSSAKRRERLQLHATPTGAAQDREDEALEWALFTEACGRRTEWVSCLAQDETCDAATGKCSSGPGEPHGGALVDLMVADATSASAATATLELSQRQACDVSLLINGGFSPLKGFMKQADYDSVVSNMRLASGHLFGLPVVLDVSDESLKGKKVLLTYKGSKLAVLEAEEVWKPDKVKEAKASYGTTSTEHPSVAELFADLGKFYVGGQLHGLMKGFDVVWGKGFNTPAQVRAALPAGKQVVAFQNRNPVHKAHFELLVHANKDVQNSIILVHPTCGPTQPGDIDGPTRIKTYEVLQEEPEYKKWAGENFRWSYLPYSMKMAGPREAIQHMIIRKNFGATHFIIGRDMAGTKSTLTSEDFYGAYEAQEMGKKHSQELNVKVVDYPNMVYAPRQDWQGMTSEEYGEYGYIADVDAKAKGLKINKLSGTEFRKRLRSGEDIPEWFAFPKVVKVGQSKPRGG
ncbi:unnamed protein product [Durusdinium trenchii]|uniref:sulfate adenylyltransferase n=1 Tax=Durusdinium trenchii TaxID=1381693 RepID=A0ABP0KFI6_9DINO